MKVGVPLLASLVIACAPPHTAGSRPDEPARAEPVGLDAAAPTVSAEGATAGPPLATRVAPAPSASATAARAVAVAPPYRMRLVDEHQHDLPAFVRDGRAYTLGDSGARYSIVVTNPSDERVEAVVSVDGLDVLDGEPASYEKRGYVIAPHGDVVLDGFRTSHRTIATFRFSSVDGSYAAKKGLPRDIGVIGVAFFGERKPDPEPAPTPMHAPARRRAAPLSLDLVPHPASPTPMPSPSPPAPPPRVQAPSTPPLAPAAPALTQRPGLGTAFGEERESWLGSAGSFVRASDRPLTVASLRYDDRAGLAAIGIVLPAPSSLARETELRETAEPFRTSFAKPPP